MPKRRKAMSRVKKSEKKATVDFRVQMRRRKVKMNQPNKKRPKEFSHVAFEKDSRSSTMAKPPGVRMMAKESQKPPYEESAVAPNVFPIAISLTYVSLRFALEYTMNIPHAGKELNKTAVTKRQRDHNVGVCYVERSNVDQGQDKCRQCES